jgi:hypothetical protein
MGNRVDSLSAPLAHTCAHLLELGQEDLEDGQGSSQKQVLHGAQDAALRPDGLQGTLCLVTQICGVGAGEREVVVQGRVSQVQ